MKIMQETEMQISILRSHYVIWISEKNPASFYQWFSFL